MISNILTEIKSKTHENHERLESNELLKSLVLNNLDLSTYLKILSRFHGFFSPLENYCEGKQELIHFLPDFDTRRKSSLLEADMHYICTLTGSECEKETCKDLPEITNTSQAFGCIYVMEGSTLGGQVIYRNLEKNLKLSYDKGASFFYGYGSETGQRWKDFKNGFLNFSDSNQTTQKDIVDAAVETFEKLDKWFKK